MPSDVRFAIVRNLAEKHGWKLIRTRGSHHVFQKPDGSSYAIPVHHGKVKSVYVRQIRRQVGED